MDLRTELLTVWWITNESLSWTEQVSVQAHIQVVVGVVKQQILGEVTFSEIGFRDESHFHLNVPVQGQIAQYANCLLHRTTRYVRCLLRQHLTIKKSIRCIRKARQPEQEARITSRKSK